MKKVIMGGSGSTGSSLLKNILNRNEAIFSGGETSLLSKRLIYDDWAKAKSKVLKRKLGGMRNFGFHIYNGTDVLLPEYNWSESDLKDALGKSKTLDAFLDEFIARGCAFSDVRVWIEKTPSNAACFSSFLNHFQFGMAIHMVRNPYDTIASLWSRGLDLYYAVGVYLLNTASGLTARHFRERNYTVAYEDLVKNPKETVSEVCQFLNITYKDDMLESQGEVIANSQLSGWNYDETSTIGKGAIGRFSKLSDEEQNAIHEAINLIHINNRGMDYYDLDVSSVKEICALLGYKYYDIGSAKTKSKLITEKKKDRLQRLRRGYPTGFYYPLDIR